MNAVSFRSRVLPFVSWLLLTTLIGILAGLVVALRTCLANSYFHESFRHLGGRFLEAGALDGAGYGLLAGLVGLTLYIAIGSIVARFRKFPSAYLTNFHSPVAALASRATVVIAMFAASLTTLAVTVSMGQLWRNASAQAGPHVIVILIDALRADRLGSYGYQRSTSPHIDEFARQAWLFTDAIAQASFTKPSVASLLTGLYARETSVSSGVWAEEGPAGRVLVRTLAAEHITLAETLASMGFETGAFGKNHHLLPEIGFAQGFLTYDWIRSRREGLLGRLRRKPEPQFVAADINDSFLDWSGKLSGRRYFAYLHHLDVHWPYRSPPPFKGMFATVSATEDFNATKFMPDTVAKLQSGELKFLDSATLTAMSDAYDEAIRHVDDRLGKLFAELKRRNQYDNALIVITADHGEEFMEHGLIGHGESLYEEVVHVPLIIKFPCPSSFCGSRTVTSQVELIDVFPTLLKAVGKQPLARLAGRTLVDERLNDKTAFTEKYNEIAIRTPEWKLIYDEIDGTAEMFNLRSDPAEKLDLSEKEPSVRRRMTLKVVDHAVMTRNDAISQGVSVEADQRMLDSLRALGYVK